MRVDRMLIVSDHAVLRYLERRHGVDVEGARSAIQSVCTRGAGLEAPAIIHDGIRFVLRYDEDRSVVVTALDRRWHGRIRSEMLE